MNSVTELAAPVKSWTAHDQRAEEIPNMVTLVFTGIASRNPSVRITDNGNTIATFSVDVKEQPHLPPTRINVIALGKQALYAEQTVRKDSLVMVAGWFCVEQNRAGNEFVEVKAKHLRTLIP
jgi:Single-strand binding protein family